MSPACVHQDYFLKILVTTYVPTNTENLQKHHQARAFVSKNDVVAVKQTFPEISFFQYK